MNDLTKVMVAPCRFAMRVEDDRWCAYIAPLGTSYDNDRNRWTFVGSIAMGFIDKDISNSMARFETFKRLMIDCMHDAIEDALGRCPIADREWPVDKTEGTKQ